MDGMGWDGKINEWMNEWMRKKKKSSLPSPPKSPQLTQRLPRDDFQKIDENDPIPEIVLEIGDMKASHPDMGIHPACEAETVEREREREKEDG